MAQYNKHGEAYPHEGACPGCREERKCNVCGTDITARNRCTNGRCSACHAIVCTPGGETSPGHAFGKAEVAVQAAKRRNHA